MVDFASPTPTLGVINQVSHMGPATKKKKKNIISLKK